ncbi:MAG: hypothetical protein AB7U38_13170 [Hyphomicrobiales bacterium]
MSRQAEKWRAFAAQVEAHIDNYVVPQYGDEGEDLASDYSAAACVEQAKKYLARFGRNSRPGEERRDLLKVAHYVQKAADRIGGANGA